MAVVQHTKVSLPTRGCLDSVSSVDSVDANNYDNVEQFQRIRS